MIADTTFLIDLLVGRDDAKAFAADHYVTTTAITRFEIYQGLQDGERQRVDSLFEELLVFPLTGEAARIAGDMQRGLREEGAEIDPEDTMIAGIAEAKDLPVLTRNTEHFERLNIDVETY